MRAATIEADPAGGGNNTDVPINVISRIGGTQATASVDTPTLDGIPGDASTDQVLKFDTQDVGYFNSATDHDWYLSLIHI